MYYILKFVRNEKIGIPRYNYGESSEFATLPSNSRYSVISQGLWEVFMEHRRDQYATIPSFSFLCFSTNKFSMGSYLRYVYKDSETLGVYGVCGEIVLKENQFKSYINKRTGCRFLFDKDSDIYREVVENENIVNDFLKRHEEYRIVKFENPLKRGEICENGMFQCDMNILDSDSMFVAKLQRK